MTRPEDHERGFALSSALLEPETRAAAAQDLARDLGADQLIVFVVDREVGALLPAPGFPPTLPEGRRWHAFLEQVGQSRRYVGCLPFPDAETWHLAEGIGLGDGSAAVLLGGNPAERDWGLLPELLPFVTAFLRLELELQVVEARSQSARQVVVEARTLASALERSRDDLRSALIQVRQGRDLLARELETRDAFLSAVAHDLKNPLTSIKGIAQILGRRVARANLGQVEWLVEGLAVLDQTATRMTTQLDQLLDVTHLHLGRPLELDWSSVDLVELARRMVEVAQKTTEAHEIQLAGPTTLVGTWDAVRIERVIANLLTNAVKYSPGGGIIRVTISRKETDGRAWAVIVVQDQGMGIPAADLPLIFERFHRAGNASGLVGGMGIGLASARQIVDEHGGTIEVVSQLGAGSTFTVRLPLPPEG